MIKIVSIALLICFIVFVVVQRIHRSSNDLEERNDAVQGREEERERPEALD